MPAPTYIGPYKVVKIMRKSNRRRILERGLTQDEARRCVSRYPNSSRSMVVYMQQYSAAKYFKP